MNEIHIESSYQDKETITLKLKTPKELKEYLDKYVIGQEKAKRTLCTAVYNHYKRLYLNTQTSLKDPIDKSNVILLGPSGCGKTYMVKLLADFIGVPYYIGDATSITQAGYVGDDVETLLVGLLRACDYDINHAQCGIVFIDEVDKLAKRNSGPNLSGKDPVGEGVQQALLKIVEGNVVGVPPQGGRKHPEQPLTYIDTSNILFIGSGSFAGIEDIVRQRVKPNGKIGFNSSDDSDENFTDETLYEYVCQEDMKKFGFIPEFIGRFPIIANVNPLTKEELCKIISEPENNILSQYATLFSVDDITLQISNQAIETIADFAIKLKTGARAIRSLLECVMEDYMFDAPGSNIKTVAINSEYVKEKLDIRYKNIKSDKDK